jgi:hypothetical protein
MAKATKKSKKQATNTTLAKAPVAVATAPHHLPSGWQHLKNSAQVICKDWRYFLSFAGLYAVLSFALVHNFASDAQAVKEQIAGQIGTNPALINLGTFAWVVSSSTGGTGPGIVYQYVLFVLGSLALIWGLRQRMSQNPEGPLRLKDSMYEGMYPLIPFLLVLAVLLLELLPLLAGSSLYSLILSNGIATTFIERALWFMLFLACTGVSVWLVTYSLFAMYIVTLPGMKPKLALRDAKRLVQGRQLNVIRKLLYLVVVLLVVGAVLTLPFIVLFAKVTAFVLFILGLFVLPFVHVYLYGLYRELLS